MAVNVSRNTVTILSIGPPKFQKITHALPKVDSVPEAPFLYPKSFFVDSFKWIAKSPIRKISSFLRDNISVLPTNEIFVTSQQELLYPVTP